VGIAQF